MSVDMLTWVSFFGLVTGILARAFLPYWRKILSGETITFQMRYIAIIIASFITAFQVFPKYTPVTNGLLVTFWAAATFGFGLQSVYSEAYKWVEGTVKGELEGGT